MAGGDSSSLEGGGGEWEEELQELQEFRSCRIGNAQIDGFAHIITYYLLVVSHCLMFTQGETSKDF